jgi:hypothetical protein
MEFIGVPQPWPSSTMVKELVKNFSGHFIYVSTVLKYIDDKNFCPPDRLELILGIKGHNFGSPFNTLDKLYLHILSKVPLDSRSQLLRILTPMTCGFDDMDALEVEHFLELQPDDLDLLLRRLHTFSHRFPWERYSPDYRTSRFLRRFPQRPQAIRTISGKGQSGFEICI